LISSLSELASNILKKRPNGLRYLRWGGDGGAVQLEKGWGVENAQKTV
jgi:hypothetical protein